MARIKTFTDPSFEPVDEGARQPARFDAGTISLERWPAATASATAPTHRTG